MALEDEVIIVEDDPDYGRVASMQVETAGLTPLLFSLPSEALEHLRCRRIAPRACLVDMNPVSEPYLKSLPPEEQARYAQERACPERIYALVRSRGWEGTFLFTTAHLSEHDEGVLERTGARVHMKERHLGDALDDLIKNY